MQRWIGNGCSYAGSRAAGIGVTELALVVCAGWALAAMIAAVPHIGAVGSMCRRVSVAGAAGGSSGGVPGRGDSGRIAEYR